VGTYALGVVRSDLHSCPYYTGNYGWYRVRSCGNRFWYIASRRAVALLNRDQVIRRVCSEVVKRIPREQ